MFVLKNKIRSQLRHETTITLNLQKNLFPFHVPRQATRTAPSTPLTRSISRPESGVKRFKIEVHMVRHGGTWALELSGVSLSPSGFLGLLFRGTVLAVKFPIV